MMKCCCNRKRELERCNEAMLTAERQSNRETQFLTVPDNDIATETVPDSDTVTETQFLTIPDSF